MIELSNKMPINKANYCKKGGDARRLTAIGYSAGGAAISALGMSPYGRSLFHQAIQMSGSMLAPTKSGTFVANDTMELAKVLKCPNGLLGAWKVDGMTQLQYAKHFQLIRWP
jgi:carboxylesterase type B